MEYLLQPKAGLAAAAAKANTQEAGAGVKEGGLFVDAAHLEDGGLMSQIDLSVEAEVSIRRERGTELRDQGRGDQSSLLADDHSPL